MVGSIEELLKEYERLGIWQGEPISLHSRTMLGDTVLHMAASRGDSDAVRILLNAGANPNEIGDMSETALHNVVKSKQYEIALILLSAGASQKLKSEFGKSPFDLASDSGDSRMLRIFRNFSHRR